MDPFSQHLQDLALAHAEIARAGIEAGRREGDAVRRAAQNLISTAKLARAKIEALRRAAQNLVTIAEHYPNAMLPTPLTAAILVLKEKLK